MRFCTGRLTGVRKKLLAMVPIITEGFFLFYVKETKANVPGRPRCGHAYGSCCCLYINHIYVVSILVPETK